VIRKKEEIDDNQSKQKMPKQLQFGYTIEQQVVDMYNINIYIKFMNQLNQTEKYKYKEIQKGEIFEVWYKSNQIKERQRIRKYIVITDLTEGKEEFSCICGKFRKDGIFCTHILKVILEEEVKKIPNKYFLDRWRKKETKIRAQPLEKIHAHMNC
jgi:TusA-related sulfurtransferase